MSTISFWILLFLSYGVNAFKVSFFGDSYISMPLQEAKFSTYIRLKFKTRQNDGLIFATSGRLDSCVLQIFTGTLKLSMNIGNNSVELYSPAEHQLNDGQWHEVSLVRYETNITFQIDNHFVRHFISPEVGKLNIHFGIYIGGLGDFSITSVKDDSYFRGCISDVYYNNISILKRAKDNVAHITTRHISWICEEEFDATENESISFMENDSYSLMSYHKQLESFHLEFKTSQTKAPLMMAMNGQNILLLEISNGIVKLTFENSSNRIDVFSDKLVSDGLWHRLELKQNEIFVDNKTYNTNQTFILNEKLINFYIGGIPTGILKKSKIIKDSTDDYALKGCIRKIFFNNIQKGFPDFHVTKNIKTDCIWEYPCLSKKPCILSGKCIQMYTSKFACQCEQLYCIRADFKEPYSLFTHVEEILQVHPVSLSEDESVYLADANIAVQFDYGYYKITEHSIYFNVVQLPKHGTLVKINTHSRELSTKNFSYYDILQTNIKYVHNGKEEHIDQMTLDMTFQQPMDLFPESHRFILHFNITPVNDPPQLSSVKNTVFRLVENIAELFSSHYIHLEDSDSLPETLIYKVITPKNKLFNGHFKVDGNIVDTFSHKDVLDKRVYFIVEEQVTDDMRFEIFLEVSDGIKTSPIISIPALVKPLQLKMVNNTGLIMSHSLTMKISHFNLSFEANSINNSFDIYYNIIANPQSGIIEKKRMIDGSWIEISYFTNRQLYAGQIRYRHTNGSPIQDEFKFIVKCFSYVSQIYDFRIRFVQFMLKPVNIAVLKIKGEKKSIVKSHILKYQTVPENILSDYIVYTLITPSKYGSIITAYENKLNFTQRDLDDHKVSYELFQTTYSDFEDEIKYVVSTPKCSSIFESLKIRYEVNNSLKLSIAEQNQEIIQLIEGGRSTISRINLPIILPDFPFLYFKVTTPPSHGVVCRYTHKFNEESINVFTLSNLNSGEIQYCHDDSESLTDKFQLLIYTKNELDFQFIATLQTDIKLKNDNEPFRVSFKPLLVVKGNVKVLSKDVLQYNDIDIDTTLDMLLYKNVAATNGWIYIGNEEKNYFTQQQINSNEVYFKHNRESTDSGNITFVISDGLYEQSGYIETKANRPFMNMQETDVLVKENSNITLDDEVIKLNINFDTNSDYIEYEIIMDPMFGELLVKNQQRYVNLTELKKFTHTDVANKVLYYLNHNKSSHDSIRLSIKHKELKSEGSINFRIYPSDYWNDLRVRNNETLYVEELKQVNITRKELEVYHESTNDPKEIVFVLKKVPTFGYLKLDSVTLDPNEFKHFDQNDVNLQQLSYVQTEMNSTSDYFFVDVTNGITWLKNLKISIAIVSNNIQITTKTVKLKKGETSIISIENIVPQSKYYESKIFEYIVTEGPRFGNLLLKNRTIVQKFTNTQLINKEITYKHSGKINGSDSLKLIAITSTKESLPFTLEFDINTSDANRLILFKKNNLSCGKYGRVTLTDDHLLAVDTESSKKDILYMVTFIEGGKLLSIEKEEIVSFTQLDLNHKLITYINLNPKVEQKLKFYITNGQYNTTEEELNIYTTTMNENSITNVPLSISPSSWSKITADNIYFQSLTPNNLVHYRIQGYPTFGKLLYRTNDGKFETFLHEVLQSDIENSRILYYNTHQQERLNYNDSFSFNVISFQGFIMNDQKFIFRISTTLNIFAYIKYETVRVEEGSTMRINVQFSSALDYVRQKTGLLSQNFVIKCHEPLFGRIKLHSDSRSNANFLTPDDFYKNHVLYEHDHSDTTQDRVILSLYLAIGHAFLCDLTIPVLISPINDKTFSLLTKFPEMTVVNGENETITHEHLLTHDIDTASLNIVYEIISFPAFGRIIKKIDRSTYMHIGGSNNKFTQKDINQKRIIYSHIGPSKQTSFDFKVWDGKHHPVTATFVIKTIEVLLDCNINRKDLDITQGITKKNIAFENLNIHTNINKYRLNFNVTTPAQSGFLLKENNTVSQFNFDDVISNHIYFFQHNLSYYHDVLKIIVYVSDVENVCHINLNIKVKPFVSIDSILLLTNDEKRLSLTSEKKSQLLRTDSNVRFIIKVKPKWGFLTNIWMSKESKNGNTSISSFTAEQVENGLIYYRLNKNQVFPNDTVDEISYLVKTNLSEHTGYDTAYIHISKAHQKLNITDDDIYSINVKLSNYSFTAILVISIVTTFLLIIIVFSIKHILHHKKKTKKNVNEPPILPFPPGYLYNNILSNYTSNNSLTVSTQNAPMISALPNCKVISLASSPFGDSQIDDFVNYDEDEDDMPKDWDSFKESLSELNQSVYQNPLLRRNQYWV